MIRYLVDADWLVDYLKGKEDALNLLTPLIEQESLATSIIVYAEIYEGLLDTSAAQGYLQALADFLSGVLIPVLDTRTAQIFARDRANLRSHGQLIPDHDLWIAATALCYDLALISRDQHFERIPDLKRHP